MFDSVAAMTTYPLGRNVDHDPRNRDYEHEMGAVQPKTVLWPHTAPVLDQGQVGSCTGNALTQWLNVDVNRKGRPALTEQDALNLYSKATKVDGIPGTYPPDDTGSSGRAVCKAGEQLGYLSAYKWTFSFAGLLNALQSGPVITGTNWHQSMFEPDADGFIHVSGEVAGGHEYLILGCDMEHQFLTILNSWSASWGQNGRAKISFADYQKLQAERGDVTIPVLKVPAGIDAGVPAPLNQLTAPSSMPTQAYVFDAKLVSFVDGDTIWADVHLGFDVHTTHKLRFAGINCPEISTPEGVAAAKFTKEWLTQNCPDGTFLIQSFKSGTEMYGRYLARIWASDGKCLNDDLLASGNAVVMN